MNEIDIVQSTIEGLRVSTDKLSTFRTLEQSFGDKLSANVDVSKDAIHTWAQILQGIGQYYPLLTADSANSWYTKTKEMSDVCKAQVIFGLYSIAQEDQVSPIHEQIMNNAELHNAVLTFLSSPTLVEQWSLVFKETSNEDAHIRLTSLCDTFMKDKPDEVAIAIMPNIFALQPSIAEGVLREQKKFLKDETKILLTKTLLTISGIEDWYITNNDSSNPPESAKSAFNIMKNYGKNPKELFDPIEDETLLEAVEAIEKYISQAEHL